MKNKFNKITLKEMFEMEKLFEYFKKFRKGKTSKDDVCEFILHLYKNILEIHSEINSGKYEHQKYAHFVLNDTKKRDIHKASVKDRFVHFVLFKNLYPYFEKVFIYDSYSCQVNKGTQKAVYRFLNFAQKCSKNNTKTTFVLKLDIKKCFASIDKNILKKLLKKYIEEQNLLVVLFKIIDSFSISVKEKGIPLGNVTSQVFINIYLHELDIYIKNILQVKFYIRYADDFIILDNNIKVLENYKNKIEDFFKRKAIP